MNEAETRAELIDPALKAAGWGVVEASRVRREVITLGRLQGAGVRSAQDIADYVLTYRNHKLAVIEAKRRDLSDTEGVGQAKKYAGKLQTRFAYSTSPRPTSASGSCSRNCSTGSPTHCKPLSARWRSRKAASPPRLGRQTSCSKPPRTASPPPPTCTGA